jgi:hypothetical protein
MKITGVEPFILHVPVTGSQIADSTPALQWTGPQAWERFRQPAA